MREGGDWHQESWHSSSMGRRAFDILLTHLLAECLDALLGGTPAPSMSSLLGNPNRRSLCGYAKAHSLNNKILMTAEAG